MKAKLLKKLRIEYSIVRYTEVGDNASNFLVECRDEFHYPFYVLEDWTWGIDELPISQWGVKTLQEAKDKLLEIARKDYKYLSVKNKVKKRKVWYNKK